MRSRCNAPPGRPYLATAIAFALGAALAVLLPLQSRASPDTVVFSTSPALYPAFAPAVSDYAVRCTGTAPVQVTVSNSDAADTSTLVTVDSQPLTSGAFASQVSLAKGQRFRITAVQGVASKSYSIRCLPDAYPTWGSQRPGSPQAEYYVVVPVPSTGAGTANRYIAIYDTNGVPVWWTRPQHPLRPVDAKLIPVGGILWTESENNSSIRGLKAEHRGLDGSVVDDSISPVPHQSDAHEVQLLDNGNYLVIGTTPKCCYNLSSHGGPASATIRNTVIQEVTPAGSALWTWLGADHMGIDEVRQQWWTTIMQAGSPYDVFHMNSAITDAAGDILISVRYTNAVYKLTNPAAPTNPGKIIWKLGGSAPTVEPGTRLTVSGDPVFSGGGGFGGQHYARYYEAGDTSLYVSLYDNGSSLGRPPRGVRYRIDEAAKTATLVEDVRDTANPGLTSFCCGNAAKLPSGNWVMSWGGNPLVTELTASGSRAFVLTFSASSYRVDPVLPATLTREQLRTGMDAQHPRVGGPIAVPELESWTQAAAATAIAALGLTVGAVTAAASDTVPAGSLISLSPGPGVLIAPGSAVSLVVSTGPPPAPIPVPSLGRPALSILAAALAASASAIRRKTRLR